MILTGRRISRELASAIEKHYSYGDKECKILDEENVAVILSRYWSGPMAPGSPGDFSVVTVLYGDRYQVKEWQYTYMIHPSLEYFNGIKPGSLDKPENRVDSIGEIKVSEKNDHTVVTVELVNDSHHNRWATFRFPDQITSGKNES